MSMFALNVLIATSRLKFDRAASTWLFPCYCKTSLHMRGEVEVIHVFDNASLLMSFSMLESFNNTLVMTLHLRVPTPLLYM